MSRRLLRLAQIAWCGFGCLPRHLLLGGICLCVSKRRDILYQVALNKTAGGRGEMLLTARHSREVHALATSIPGAVCVAHTPGSMVDSQPRS